MLERIEAITTTMADLAWGPWLLVLLLVGCLQVHQLLFQCHCAFASAYSWCFVVAVFKSPLPALNTRIIVVHAFVKDLVDEFLLE